MSEAKQRRLAAAADPVVYHHTSTLRTNLMWMSGVIAVEGDDTPVLHPKLGELKTDTKMRREMVDFPPLAWFTTRIDPPRCLTDAPLLGINHDTGKIITLSDEPGTMNAIALNRIAIGFRLADVQLVRWADHHGYQTDEGRALNESAREFGDDPGDWYVSETPVDIMLSSEVWSSSSIMKPKMRRSPSYLPEMKKMVKACRENEGVFIPPSWLPTDQAAAVIRRSGVPVLTADQL
jgi:hypothetical protein